MQNSGSNLGFGVTEDSKLYFDLSSPSPKDAFGKTDAKPVSFNGNAQ